MHNRRLNPKRARLCQVAPGDAVCALPNIQSHSSFEMGENCRGLQESLNFLSVGSKVDLAAVAKFK
jgi:hypothetical protein